jgi:chaperonin cofactor prefoldin
MQKEDKPKSLEHELYEIKQEIMADTYQFRLIEKQLNTYQITYKKNEIIEKEIGSLPNEVKVYDKIGRLFVLSDKKKICDGISESQKLISKDIENQKQLYKKYQDKLNENSKHYNEVAQTKRN